MQKNKKRRIIREKNDTLIKWFQLSQTSYLNDEEFGAVVRQVMIHDDKEGKRYNNLTDEAIEELKEAEIKWKEQYQKLKFRNPMVGAAFNSLSIQVNISTEGYHNLAKRLNKDDDNDDDDNDEENETDNNKPNKPQKSTDTKNYMTDTFDIELEDGSAIIFNATYNEETNDNIPSKYELTEFIKELEATADEQAEILQRIERQGMLDKWKRHWKEYIEERSIFDD